MHSVLIRRGDPTGRLSDPLARVAIGLQIGPAQCLPGCVVVTTSVFGQGNGRPFPVVPVREGHLDILQLVHPFLLPTEPDPSERRESNGPSLPR